jgi:hypothetical protein
MSTYISETQADTVGSLWVVCGQSVGSLWVFVGSLWVTCGVLWADSGSNPDSVFSLSLVRFRCLSCALVAFRCLSCALVFKLRK